MDRGIFVAASGGMAQQRRMDIVSNNLANMGTVGFKAERMVTRQQQFADTLAATMPKVSSRAPTDQNQTPGVVDIQTETDFTPGPVAFTGDPLNVALMGANQFFVVQTGEGVAYTRAGNFLRNADGALVSPDGKPVLGEGGPISLPPGEAKITSNGSVLVNNDVVARLRVVEVQDLSKLRRTEGVRFVQQGGGDASAVPASLVPQSVEMPNISTVQSMVELINTSKAFEAYTKTIGTIDQLNEISLKSAKAQ